MGKKMNQRDRISLYMDQFGSITTLDAFTDLGVTRLASRIAEMIEDGVKIEKKMETGKNRFGESVSYMRYKKAV